MPIKTYANSTNQKSEKTLAGLLRKSKIPDDELIKNLGLYLTPGTLGRLIYISRLYEKIITQQGIIMEFGSRFGQNLVLFSLLRSIFEPYNRLRKVVGFDTFAGFPSVHDFDGQDNKENDYDTGEFKPTDLSKLMAFADDFGPLAHLNNMSEIVIGDASETVPAYLDQNPHTVIALCYFDLDLYKPTLDCLKAVEPYLTKGSILAFDELNDEDMPGETIAMREFFSEKQYAVLRDPISARTSYMVWGET